jgi:hypothetical protein
MTESEKSIYLCKKAFSKLSIFDGFEIVESTVLPLYDYNIDLNDWCRTSSSIYLKVKNKNTEHTITNSKSSSDLAKDLESILGFEFSVDII